jgi:hypothetical protein
VDSLFFVYLTAFRWRLDAGGFEEIPLHVAPDFEVALRKVRHELEWRITAHHVANLSLQLRLLLDEQLQAFFQVRRKNALHRISVKTDNLGQNVGGEQRFTAGFLFHDDLQQRGARDVGVGIGVHHFEFNAPHDQLANVSHGNVAAHFSIVQAPVGILLDYSCLSSFSDHIDSRNTFIGY